MKKLLLTILGFLFPLLSMAQEAYAVLSEGNTVLTFYYDNNKDSHGRYIIIGDGDVRFSWFEETWDITSVVFDPSFANCTSITSTSGWFAECKQLSSISGIEYLNTSNVTDMSWMFTNCTALSALDLSGFNTFNVANMSNMFDACSSLTTLDLSSFNTSNVTDMSMMFVECIALSTLDLSSFNTSNVTDMSMMFSGCSSLTALDLSGFNTSNVTDMSWMFCGDSVLTILDLKNFVTSNANDMKAMFSGCSSLTTLNLSNFDTSNVTDMSGMFEDCSSLTTLNLSNFDTSNVTDMSGMFWDCRSLPSLDLSGFNTSNVTDMSFMFNGCIALSALDLSCFNTSNVTDMAFMFYEDSGLTILDLKNFVTSNAIRMDCMFSQCSSLTTLDLSSFDTSNATRMDYMFSQCSSLTALDLSNFDTSNVITMSSMFSRCNSLTTLDLGNFDTSNVKYMTRMFEECGNLASIYAGSGWNTSSLTSSQDMFYGCSNLVGGRGTKYDESHIDHTYAHIDGGTANPGYLTGKNTTPGSDFEPYAVLSDNNKVLTFFYDENKSSQGGLDVAPFSSQSDVTWYHACSNITTVVFDSSFANCTSLTSTAYWFHSCNLLASINGLENLNTSNVTDMSHMFEGCGSLASLDVSNLNTSKVTNMSYIFGGMINLTNLNLGNFETSSVTDMSGMFNGCSKLITIDVSSFNTENVVSMAYMFSGVYQLSILDISNFNTAKVINMTNMFSACEKLETIYVGEAFVVSESTDGYDMFFNCSNLKGGSGTAYDLSHTDASYAHIDGGVANPGYFTSEDAMPSDESIVFVDSNVEAICVQNWDTNADGKLSYKEAAAITSLDGVFQDIGSISSFNELQYFTRLKQIETNSFLGCSSLTSVVIPSNVETINGSAFNGCTALVSIDLANVDSIRLDAFNNCSGLQSLIIPKSMKSIDNSAFNGCNSLKVIEFECPEIGSWFNGKNSIEEIIIKDGVTEIGASAFSDCHGLKSVSMADNVTTIGTAAFRYCNSLSMVKFSSSLTTIMNYAFSDCTSLDSITIPSTVVSIGSGAFNSESLRIVETEITQPFVIASNVFNDSTYTYGLLYVPQGTKDAYKNTNAWSLFFKVLEEGETPGGETPGGEIPGGETPGGETPIGGAEPYAVLSEGNTVLTFFYDANKDSRGGVDVRPFTNQEPDLYYTEYDGFYTLKWGTDSRNIVRVVFDESFKNCTSITSTAWWFFDCEKLTAIEGLNYLNTANVTTMNSMFRECFLLPNIDLSNFDTSNVTDMYGLFEGCSSMTDIDLRAFVTSKVTDMRGMFGFCSSLTILDLSHFNTSKVKNIGSMFENCIKLKTIYVGDEWDTSNIISGDSLFYDCRELVGGSGTKYNAEYIDYTYAHVDGGVANPGYLTDIASALTRFDGRTAWVYRNDSLDDAFKEVGGKDIASQTICAIVWEKDSELTAEVIDGITNPNMLIYVKDAEYAPSGFGNVIVNGVAQNITLTDVGLGNGDFYCPITFFAENISYSRTFSQNTKKGESQGWESIAMPFTVQTVRHETHGIITPFGSNDNEYPFWLRQMSGGSMTRASSIEANKPYLICMPNSNEYLPEYNQNGRIAFSSSNVMVPVTDPQTASSANGSITLVPNFQRVSQDDNVFALNVGVARGQHPEGSVFEANYRDVKPFEVYTLHSGANTRFITLSILGINDDDTTSVEDFSVTEKEKDGDWHSIDGRKLESKPHTKGVYINNGTKVIIR